MYKIYAHNPGLYAELCPACVAAMVGVGLLAIVLDATPFGVFCILFGITSGIILSSTRFSRIRRALKRTY